MIHILKDVVNPINWIKILKNPSKFIKVFNDRINYYPGLKFGYTKSKTIKKLYMSFNIFFAKKNKHFKEFFFDTENNKTEVNTNFNLNGVHNINEIQFQSLKQNGILVLENALTEYEHNKITKNFNKFKDDLSNNKIDEYKYMNLTIKKGSNLRSSYTINSDLESESNLKIISDQITQKIYGQIIKPSQLYGHNKLTNLPDSPVSGDNTWHSDRYIPNLKLLYFPLGTKEGSPFRYSLGTHKINKKYLNFFLNKDKTKGVPGTIESDDEEKIFLANTKEFSVEPNTLIVALTNGFHGRTPFKTKGERCVLYLTYSQFRLSSLIAYWKYNRSYK